MQERRREIAEILYFADDYTKNRKLLCPQYSDKVYYCIRLLMERGRRRNF